MRKARIKETGGAYYHLLSRTINRQMLLGEAEKEQFRRTMRGAEGFSGVHILTHAILDNHVHILLYVPPQQPVSDSELIRRLGFLYDSSVVQAMERRLRELRLAGQDAAADELKARYTYRMHDLSEFAKTLKQRFTQGYNDRHQRSGTLWNGRFKSILVEGRCFALATVAAYIDLNAVRAGLVGDPKEYRFCGYAEAEAGSKAARKGIGLVMQSVDQAGDWGQIAALYRQRLYVAGEQRGTTERGGPVKPGFSPQQVQAVLDAGGTLSLQELLRCRVRCLSTGAILGSRVFVDDAVQRHREHFGRRRQSGAWPMAGGGRGELCTARRPRRDPIRLPTLT